MNIPADFYNWNRVKIRYCDGASFSGDSQNAVKLTLFVIQVSRIQTLDFWFKTQSMIELMCRVYLCSIGSRVVFQRAAHLASSNGRFNVERNAICQTGSPPKTPKKNNKLPF